MVAGKSYRAEHKSMRFEFTECGCAGVDMRLLEETAKSVFGDEHKGQPIVARVFFSEMFIALASACLFHMFSIAQQAAQAARCLWLSPEDN